MKVNICGIPYEIEYCKDNFNMDTHFGDVDYVKCLIRINEELNEESRKETLCHEIVHALLIHIGRNDLSGDETFVQSLGNAISQSFEARIDNGKYIRIPDTGIGDLSDGYHTFNALYNQRLILFAALVQAHKDKAWKSHRHEDGELCFGGDWFIVGIDTPEGSFTYHYENKDWDKFDCKELERGKTWDGHTDKDVTRLLSLSKKVSKNEKGV